jgi:DNA-binding transcriptional ArsR family regulator
MTSTASLAQQLRAVADERRLRLLRLCADGPATVSALAAALSDSEPNVSRQLKQLAEAGLLRRSRQGQFVEYSLADPRDPAAGTAHWLIAQLGGEDAALRAARAALRRARGVEAARPAPVRGLAPPSRFGRTLAAALAASLAVDARARRVLVRSPYPELITALAAEAAAVALVAVSTAERAALRRWAVERGLGLGVDLEEPLAARARAEGCDLVVLESPATDAAPGTSLGTGFALARRLLRPGGHAWLMADYDALAAGDAPGGAAPLQRLRALAQAAGFECQDLLPVEAEGHHVLVARARAPATDASLARSA